VTRDAVRSVILGGARTPMTEWSGGKTGAGKPGGRLRDVSANDLGAVAARAALARTQVKPEEIQHVVMGNALQTSGDAIYGARHVGLKAGVPQHVPALTVNRLCGSGIQSIVTATQLVQLGEADTILAGGMENLSQAPHVLRGLRSGLKLGQGQLEDLLLVSLRDSWCGLLMAQTAEKLARERGISRAEQDAYAFRSMSEARRARASGVFDAEITPVVVKSGRGDEEVRHDDHLFDNPSLEVMSQLPPAFGKDGMVTAGNASGIVDGGAAVVVMSPEKARAEGRQPLAEVLAWAATGVDPSIMGIGPVPAIRQALAHAGLRLEEVDLFEINEAFAAQYLAVEKELGLQRERVNVNGGAIAIGHPLAATGTRLVLTLGLELQRRRRPYGVASACIGGGQGIAIVLRNPAA
jgi:acetyl-CoA acetyltransferase family protein